MNWSFGHLAGLLGAARLPLQVAVLTYVGAGGLAGAAVVGGVMLSPARDAVQKAVAPARAFVESVMPMGGPPIFPMDARQAVASEPIAVSPPRASVATPMAESAAPAVDDAVADKPVAAIEAVRSVMPGRPAVAISLPASSLPSLPEALVQPTAVPTMVRIAVSVQSSDYQHAAAVTSPPPIPASAPTSREPTPTVPAAPTQAPTSAPTQVPTQQPTAVPTQAPPKQPTAVPTQVPAAPSAMPTKGPQRPVKLIPAPTPLPARAVPSAPPAKDKHDKSGVGHAKPSEPHGRTADAPPPTEHEGD